MRLSVPGTILLLGEYAILEEGGLGLAMAVEKRVQLVVEPAPSLRIRALWPGVEEHWPGSVIPVLSSSAGTVEQWLSGRGSRNPCASITVDSSPLFRRDGTKAGLGSSAAAAVGIVSALLALAGAYDKENAAMLAVKAHRAAQGGVGSGYDVLCSLHGGMGVFHGGQAPSWTPCSLSWDLSVLLFQGPRAVRTPHAVQAYTRWKGANGDAARSFLARSNDAVRAFVQAGSAQEALRHFSACRQIGCDLGEAIGVPARIDAPHGLDPSWCKALGAGDELGAYLRTGEGGRAAGAQEASVWPAPRSEEGLLWEQ